MAVQRITNEIEAALSREKETRVVPICAATHEEWRQFSECESQLFRSKQMEWVDGRIYIVEKASQEHEKFVRKLETAMGKQPAFERYMASYGESTPPGYSALPYCQADNSFGPKRATGDELPQGVPDFESWYSLVVENGHLRGWGTEPGQLDWKTQQWARFPGVHFILCVSVSDRLKSAEFKLYTVDPNTRTTKLSTLNPVPIMAPHAVVNFDSRELLGLLQGADLPIDQRLGQQFASEVNIDLYEILEVAGQNF